MIFLAPIFSQCSNFWKAQCKYDCTCLSVIPTFGGVAKFAPRVHPLWKPQMVKNWKTAIFVLITFLCMMIPNAHSAPGGTKKTRVKIHQWLCQINYTIFLFWKLYSKLDFNTLVFATKKYKMDVFKILHGLLSSSWPNQITIWYFKPKKSSKYF